MNNHTDLVFPALEIVCRSVPDRLNEDAWLAMQAGPLGETIVMAVIDGATTRLTPPALERYLATQPEKLTPAAYSARLARDSLARQIGTGMPSELRTLLLEANADLGRDLIRLLGALTLDAMDFPEEIQATVADDPRMVRLGLPASVVTVAEYDPLPHRLRYAHAGDALLLVVYRDGHVSVPTRANDPRTDHALMQTALKMRDYYPDLPFCELVQLPEVQHRNLTNALHHNYVDEHGLPQPSRGVGVIDGLPELRYFVQTGEVALEDAALVCVMTDGLEWPASAQEVFADDPDQAAELCEQRCTFMGEQIAGHGLSGYLERLRQAEAGDPDFERYPRMKTHDDATGVLLRFA